MRTAHTLLVALVTLGSAAGLSAALHAGEPPASATQSSAPVVSAALSASQPVRGADLAADPSNAPASKEWNQAKPVAVTAGDAGSCKLSMIREWLRVSCEGRSGVSLVAGDPKSARMWASKDTSRVAIAEVQLRRGASLIVTFLGVQSHYEWASLAEDVTLHVSWLTGTDDPIVIMTSPMRVPE